MQDMLYESALLCCLLLGICTIYPHAPVYALPNDYHRSRHHHYHSLLEPIIKRNERLIILKRKRPILVTIISLLDTLEIVTSVVGS